MGHLFADDLVLGVNRRRRQADLFDGHGLVKAQIAVALRLARGAPATPVMLGNGDLGAGRILLTPFAERELLAVGIDETPLGTRSE